MLQRGKAPVAYLGCYKDDAARDLKHGPRAYGYTPASCVGACRGYKYVALQNNGQCFCDDSYGTPNGTYTRQPEAECNGGRGGPWRNAIYQNPSPGVAPWGGYQGPSYWLNPSRSNYTHGLTRVRCSFNASVLVTGHRGLPRNFTTHPGNASLQHVVCGAWSGDQLQLSLLSACTRVSGHVWADSRRCYGHEEATCKVGGRQLSNSGVDLAGTAEAQACLNRVQYVRNMDWRLLTALWDYICESTAVTLTVGAVVITACTWSPKVCAPTVLLLGSLIFSLGGFLKLSGLHVNLSLVHLIVVPGISMDPYIHIAMAASEILAREQAAEP